MITMEIMTIITVANSINPTCGNITTPFYSVYIKRPLKLQEGEFFIKLECLHFIFCLPKKNIFNLLFPCRLSAVILAAVLDKKMEKGGGREREGEESGF